MLIGMFTTFGRGWFWELVAALTPGGAGTTDRLTSGKEIIALTPEEWSRREASAAKEDALIQTLRRRLSATVLECAVCLDEEAAQTGGNHNDAWRPDHPRHS
jgi:hypothetical protein